MRPCHPTCRKPSITSWQGSRSSRNHGLASSGPTGPLGQCDRTPSSRLAIRAANLLSRVYDVLSRRHDVPIVELCKEFTVLLLALHRGWPDSFAFKPKVHMMIELLEYGTPGARPSAVWTYRDEEFGGSLKHLAQASGGPMSPAAVGKRVLLRFCAMEPLQALGAQAMRPAA